MKFSGKIGNGPMNKRLNFGGNSDHDSKTSDMSVGFIDDRSSKMKNHIRITSTFAQNTSLHGQRKTVQRQNVAKSTIKPRDKT